MYTRCELGEKQRAPRAGLAVLRRELLEHGFRDDREDAARRLRALHSSEIPAN